MLTNSELNQIKDFLALYGKKDSQLSLVTTVNNTDYVTIVQESKNVRITVELLKRAVLEGIVSEDIFNNLWDEVPTENSRKMVRSNGIWHAINDADVIDTNQIKDGAVTTPKLHNGAVSSEKLADDVSKKIEKFAITLSASPSLLEITAGALLVSTLRTTSKIQTFGDASESPVVPKTSDLSVSSGTLTGNNWAIPSEVNTYIATYQATKNGTTRTVTANVNTNLRKYFGFSSSQPSSVEDLMTLVSQSKATSHFSNAVNCTVTIPVNGTEFNHIWFAVPSGMSITSIIQPDSLNAPLAFSYVGTINRTIVGTTYSYKLYESTDTIDSSVSKRLTIS